MRRSLSPRYYFFRHSGHHFLKNIHSTYYVRRSCKYLCLLSSRIYDDTRSRTVLPNVIPLAVRIQSAGADILPVRDSKPLLYKYYQCFLDMIKPALPTQPPCPSFCILFTSLMVIYDLMRWNNELNASSVSGKEGACLWWWWWCPLWLAWGGGDRGASSPTPQS